MNNNFPVYYEIEFYDEDRKEYRKESIVYSKKLDVESLN